LVELINKRNLNSKTFDTGRTQAHPVTGKTVPIYASKLQNGLHYAENGQYKNVDTDIKVNAKYEFSHEVTKMRGIARFGDTSANTKKHLFGVEDNDGNWLNVKLDQENHVLSTVTGNRAEFTDATHCDVKHYALYNGVKTEYVIYDKNINSLTVTFKHNDEITPEQRGNTIVYTRDDKDIFTVKSPFAYDAAVGIDVTESVVMTLGTTGEFHSATIVVDAAWLLAATSPIIDPDVTIEDGVDGDVIEDAWMWQGLPTFNFGTSTRGEVKGSTTDSIIALIKVDLSGYSGTVTTARFGVDMYTAQEAITLDWYEVLKDWNELDPNGVTYNSAKEGIDSWNSEGCRGSGTDRNAVADGSKVSVINSDFQIPISNDLASSWMGVSSNGIVVDTAATAGVTNWHSSETVNNKPYFYMEHMEEAAGGFSFFFGGINDD